MNILAEGQGELIGWHDPDENREWIRDNKSRDLRDKRMSVEAAVAQFVHDGDFIASGGFGHIRVAMAIVYEIIRQRKRHLIMAGKTAVHDIDLLIGAGCVDRGRGGLRLRPRTARPVAGRPPRGGKRPVPRGRRDFQRGLSMALSRRHDGHSVHPVAQHAGHRHAASTAPARWSKIRGAASRSA